MNLRSTPNINDAPPVVATPLLEALYETQDFDPTVTHHDLESEAIQRHVARFGDDVIPGQGLISAVELMRENERLHRMQLAWGLLKGEPKRRKAKARKKPTRKRGKGKPKPKVKWIPRKQYLAAKRKAKR